MYNNGLEFRIIYTSVRVVRSSSYDNLALPTVFLRHRFVDLIILSNNPPYHGTFSRLKHHCKPMLLLYCLTSGWVNTECMILSTDLNVFPLSDTILHGNPLLAVKRLKLCKKTLAVMFGTRPKCTALTTVHMYRHIHTFLSPPSP